MEKLSTLTTAITLCLTAVIWHGPLVPNTFAQSSLVPAQRDFDAGKDALKSRRWAEAAEAFDRAVRARPQWPAALGLLGTALVQLGKLDGAGESFKKAIRIDPNQASLHAGLASVYARQERFAEAANEFLRAVQLDPKNVDSHYNLALAFIGQQFYTKAVEELMRASRMDPSSPEILINLAAAQFLAGNSKGAAELVKSIESRWKSSPQVLYNLGLVLVQQQAWSLAADAFAQAQIEMPAETAIRMQWVKCELELHNFHEAESALTRLRDEGHDSDGIEVLLGSAEVGLGSPDLAREAFRRAEGLNAGNADAHFGVGELLFQKADVPGALAEMKEACNLAPQNLRFVLGLARILLKSRQNEEAAMFLGTRLENFRGSPDIAYLLGLAQYNLGHYSNALSSFQNTLRLNPEESRAYFMLGNTLAQLGDLAKSDVAYRNAIKRTPQSALYYLSLASLLERKGKLSEAAENLKRSIVIEPDIPFSHYALGRIDLQMGRYDEAIAELTKSLSLDPSPARPYYLLALCSERTGNQTNARKYREKFASMAAQSQREEFLNLGGELEDLPFGPSQFSHAPAAKEAPSNPHDSSGDHP